MNNRNESNVYEVEVPKVEAPKTTFDKMFTDKVPGNKDKILNIIRNDPLLKDIYYDECNGKILVKRVPWSDLFDREWNEGDDFHLQAYFQTNYKITNDADVVPALKTVVFAERSINPIRYRIARVTWDGKPRLDTMLIDCLGAADTPYVRAVTRKTLVAAVARAFEPGIKFDTMLVLCGPQGIGKSAIFNRLADPWFSDNLTMGDMKDKTGAEKLQGRWILEIPELSGMRKAEVETTKAFITRQEDQYRPAYGRYVERKARRCIIVGTTNAIDGFLRDTTGNRRFWPVIVKGSKNVLEIEQEYFDQVIAEAKHYYDLGEKLYLTDESIIAEAVAAQEDAMESDERYGIVEEFLSKKITKNWYDMDTMEHVDYLYRNSHLCTEDRMYVCNMEIFREALKIPLERLSKKDSYAIKNIMARMPGWEYQGNAKRRFGCYGNQHFYKRII